LSIGLPGRPAAVEFFPYREGWLRNAEAQVLYASDSDSDGVGARLDVRLSADGARRVRDGGDALKAAAEGIVVIDGQARELAVAVATAAFAAGSELSRVAGAPQAPAEPARRGLDLPGLGSGGGSPASPALV